MIRGCYLINYYGGMRSGLQTRMTTVYPHSIHWPIFVDEDGSRIRKDENYEKNYLLGKYGAIPVLENNKVS